MAAVKPAKYGQFIGHIASELENMDLADRRGLKVPIDRYNDRVQMWVKWAACTHAVAAPGQAGSALAASASRSSTR